MEARRRIVIVGATSSIAEHCARLWVQDQPLDLTLIGRDAVRVGRVAQDLRVRSPQSQVREVLADFTDPALIKATVNAIVADGAVDTVLIAHGSLPDQAACQDDLLACREALDINGVSPAMYAEAFAAHLSAAGRGILALIGSVAGDRGRRSNYVYGAAKGLVTRYAQGLQHRFAGTGVKVVLIKPGPTATPMTARMQSQGANLAPVDAVAHSIVKAVDRGQPLLYVPGKWAAIMFVIRHLPSRVFNKMNI